MAEACEKPKGQGHGPGPKKRLVSGCGVWNTSPIAHANQLPTRRDGM